MKRRSFLAVAAAGIFTAASFSGVARAQTPSGGESTYTATLPDKQTLKLQIKVAPAPNGGGQIVTVQSRQRNVAPAPLLLDTTLTADQNGNVQSCRATFGPTPNIGVLLEAVRQPGGGAYRVGIPEAHGSIPFSGKLFAPLLAELFVGRMYDWNRGGPQNFAWLLDAPYLNDVRVVNLTLSAVNPGKTEVVTLGDGELTVRRLHASGVLPFMPDGPAQKTESDFLVGPGGEVIKCETAFFGIPITAKGKAVYENNGMRWALYFHTPSDVPNFPRVLLRADKQGSGANALWDIGLDIGEARSAQTFAHATCDANYRLTSMETPFRGRPTKVKVTGSQLEWSIEADKGQFVAVPSGRTLWLPSWFVTSLWEGPGMPFADLQPGAGEKRTGDYFPLFTGQRDAGALTLERLNDLTASVGGRDVPVHHYRFVSKNAYEVYTDGSRLLAFIASDKTTIIRDGWEAWAKALPVPEAPAVAPPATVSPPAPQ